MFSLPHETEKVCALGRWLYGKKFDPHATILSVFLKHLFQRWSFPARQFDAIWSRERKSNNSRIDAIKSEKKCQKKCFGCIEPTQAKALSKLCIFCNFFKIDDIDPTKLKGIFLDSGIFKIENSYFSENLQKITRGVPLGSKLTFQFWKPSIVVPWQGKCEFLFWKF